jgi:hypothetical protein
VQDRQQSRRKVLKGLGAAAGIGGGVLSSVQVSAARNSRTNRDIHKQSLRVLEETNSPPKQREFLRDHGFTGTSVQASYSIPIGHGSGDIEPMNVPTRDLDISMHLFDIGYEEYDVSLSFQYEMDPGDSGEHPWDIAAMAWNSSWWAFSADTIQEATYTRGPTTIAYRSDSRGPGVSFRADDAHLPAGQRSDFFACGAYIRPVGNDSELRRVYGEFSHTWNSVEIQGVTLGWKSISVNVGNEAHEWHTDHERDGTMLILSEEEAQVI